MLRWAGTLLVLGLLFHFLPWEILRGALARVPLTRFIAVLFIYLLAVTVGIVKWRMVVNSAGARLTFAASAECYASGLFGALFLPSIVGGDLARLAVGISRSSRPAAVITGNMADRCLDMAAQLTLISLGLILLPGALPVPLQLPARRILWAATIAFGVLLVLVWSLHRPLLRGRSFRFRRRVGQVRHALRSVARRPHILLFGLLLGVCVQGTYLVLTALLAISCGLLLPLRVWLLAWPLAKIAAILPISQGGVGVREAALIVLLRPFGASPALVLAASLVWEGTIIAGGLLAGLAAFLLRRAEAT